jgi:hypothetical protein
MAQSFNLLLVHCSNSAYLDVGNDKRVVATTTALPGTTKHSVLKLSTPSAHQWLNEGLHVLILVWSHAECAALLLIPQSASRSLPAALAAEILNEILLAHMHEPLIIRLVLLHLKVGYPMLAVQLAVQVTPDHHAVVRPRSLFLLIKATEGGGLATTAELGLPPLGGKRLVHTTEAAREGPARNRFLLLRCLVQLCLQAVSNHPSPEIWT